MKRMIAGVGVLALLVLLAAGGTRGEEGKRRDAPKARNYEVRMLASPNRFDAKDIEIQVGDTVTWVNDTGAEHSATSDEGSEIKFTEVDLQKKTFSARVKFDKAGTAKYHCKFHPSMTGTITVK